MVHSCLCLHQTFTVIGHSIFSELKPGPKFISLKAVVARKEEKKSNNISILRIFYRFTCPVTIYHP
jgi:hypothetical protein